MATWDVADSLLAEFSAGENPVERYLTGWADAESASDHDEENERYAFDSRPLAYPKNSATSVLPI